MYGRARAARFNTEAQERLQKSHRELLAKMDEKMEADAKRAEERLAADRKEAAERLAADAIKAEARLAADRKEAKKMQLIAYERLAHERKESQEKLENERKESDSRYRSLFRWLVATFVSVTLGMIGIFIALAALLISNGRLPV